MELLSPVKRDIVELNVLSSKIKQVEKYKEDLKLKLSELDSNLEMLKPKLNNGSPPRALSHENKSPTNDNEERRKKAHELIQRLKREKELFQKIKEGKLKKLESKKAKLEQKEAVGEDESALKANKLKQIEGKIKKIVQRKKERDIFFEETEKKLTEIANRETLDQKLKRQYEKQKEQEIFKEKMNLKNIYKKIPEYNLDDHQKKFDDIHKQKEEERRERVETYLKDAKTTKQKYDSKIFKSLESLRLEELEKLNEKTLLPSLRAQRQKEFYYEIKEKHAPRVDEKKKMELEKIKEKMDEKKRFLEEIKSNEAEKALNQYKIGKDYLAMAKKLRKRADGKKNQKLYNTFYIFSI